VGFLAAARTGAGTFFDDGCLPEHEVRPVEGEAAAGLVSARFPELAPAVLRRVLAEAQGNPLALLELPMTLDDPQRRARATRRRSPAQPWLRALFDPVSELRTDPLPASTAALEDTGDLAVVRAAAAGRRRSTSGSAARPTWCTPMRHRQRRFRHRSVDRAALSVSETYAGPTGAGRATR
jgi:hypothetical protein